MEKCFILTKKFCVYVDFIEKDGKFIAGYVGKGNERRVNEKGRNRQHQSYAKKYEWKRVIGFETDDEDEAFEVEKLLIRELHTYVGQYADGTFDFQKTKYACNQTPGGDGVGGRAVSEKTRQLISKATKGVKRSEEVRANLKRLANDPIVKAKRTASLRRAIVELKNDPIKHAALCARNKDIANRPSTQEKRRLKMVGQKRTLEQRENMSRAQQKRGHVTPIARANMIAAQNRPEVIEKRRKSRIGIHWKLSEEQCLAISIQQTGAKRSEEAKANMKIAQGTPEARKRKSETQLGRKKTEFTLQRLRETLNRPEVKEKQRQSQLISQNKQDVKQKKSTGAKNTHALHRLAKRIMKTLGIKNFNIEAHSGNPP